MPPAKTVGKPLTKKIQNSRNDGGKGHLDYNTGTVEMQPYAGDRPEHVQNTDPWCGEFIILDDGYWLICERKHHEPNPEQDDKSPHRSTYKANVWEWGPNYEDSLTKLERPYWEQVNENGLYQFSQLSGRDVGKFIEFDQGALTIAGFINSVSFYVDGKALHKAQKKRRRGERTPEAEDDGRRVSVVVTRNNDVQSFTAKLTDEFRLHFSRLSVYP